MGCNYNVIILVLVYSFIVSLAVTFYFNSVETLKEYGTQLENMKVNCQAVYDGAAESKKFKSLQLDQRGISRELAASENLCETLEKFYHFAEKPLSAEERNFPLAFGMLVQVDAVQILFTLSLLYQPQNQFCITIDNRATEDIKKILMRLPRCFNNIRVQVGDESYPPHKKMGVLNNVWQCVTDLTVSGSPWKYYQFLAVHDIPLKTNLEMVRILKALNGSINTEIYPYSIWRFGVQRPVTPPMKLFQGEMGVALPREAAIDIVCKDETYLLLEYMKKTHKPYEAFWATLMGNNKVQFPLYNISGSFDGRELISLQKRATKSVRFEDQTPENVGRTAIARLEVFLTKPGCSENPICFYGLEDIPKLLKRPELIAHKMFMSVQPAAYICWAKELRRRSRLTNFDATSYTKMPTVELYSGKPADRLSNPNWMATNGRNEIY